ncbi:hypothetical protein OMAG_000011 [Candidatus Omnitrophus magneticus]|uniref:GtrA-like protein domain-containing protein n=1 Tax=Candidatus Omnitrophus magneticus TaxID=1609969 RepID=A0A0F0CX15_9BACT|nr:hypothetical protein OMAG_000011 [Candidatus Omnitrophus magneticus]
MSVANFLFHQDVMWWLAGLMGSIIGAVWNFAVTSTFTWNWKKKNNR